MSIDLSDYRTVSERIAEAKEKYPDGRFQSRIVEVPSPFADKFLAVEARFYRTPDDPTPAVGLAWEPVPGKTPYTRDSELMNAESSAWGRALIAAFASDASKGIASAEEVRNRQDVGETGTKPRGKPGGKNCPSCGEELEDLRETFQPGGKQPAWRCVNKTCAGGGKKKQGGNWPWASWNPHEFDDSPHAKWAKNVLWGLIQQARDKAVMAAAVPPEIDDISLGRAFWLEMLAVSGQVEPLTEEAAKAVVTAAEQVCGVLEDDPERIF